MNLFAELLAWLFGPQSKNLPYMATNDIIAICVGHSRRGDRGATSANGTSEWSYNNGLAERLKWKLEAAGLRCFVLNKYDADSYGAAMRWVSHEIEQRHATLAVELHFNASEGQAQGHEWLHWGASKDSRSLADALCKEFATRFPARKNRGAKAKTSGDRGAEFLRLTHCPAVIAEPFFGDNPNEWEFATKHVDEIADAIVAGIFSYIQPPAV